MTQPPASTDVVTFDPPPRIATPRIPNVRNVRMLLAALALVIVLLGTIVAGLSLLNDLSGHPERTEMATAVVVAVGILTLVVTLAVLLCAASLALQLLAVQARQTARQNDLLAALAERPDRPAADVPLARPVAILTPEESIQEPYAPSAPAFDLAPLARLLAEIHTTLLMSDAQRAALATSRQEASRGQLRQTIEQALAQHDFAQAERGIAELRALTPHDPALQALGDSLEQDLNDQRSTAARSEIDQASARVQHVMSISAWQQAEEIVANLRHRFGDEPTLLQLADYVHRERDALEKENYTRLTGELKDATERRDWRHALDIAQDLLRRYPHERKIEKLARDQLATITENAQAQERREEEALFTDLLHRQRYTDAADVARRVLAKYPGTPAATELAKLLPKVEELIRQENGRRGSPTP